MFSSLAVPFLVSVTREEAFALIGDVNPSLASILATKGIANILPTNVHLFLLPKLDKQRKSSGRSTEEDSVGLAKSEGKLLEVKRPNRCSVLQQVLSQIIT